MMAPGFSSAVKKINDSTKKQFSIKKQSKQNANSKTKNMGQNQSGKKIYSVIKTDKNKQLKQDQKKTELEKFEDLLEKPLKTSLEKKIL